MPVRHECAARHGATLAQAQAARRQQNETRGAARTDSPASSAFLSSRSDTSRALLPRMLAMTE